MSFIIVQYLNYIQFTIKIQPLYSDNPLTKSIFYSSLNILIKTEEQSLFQVSITFIKILKSIDFKYLTGKRRNHTESSRILLSTKMSYMITKYDNQNFPI